MGDLKRTLNLTEVIFFAAGVILGAGIYTVIGKAAGLSGNMLWVSFLIAALTAVLSLFAYAELSALYPGSGGEYDFVKEAVSPRWAYVVGSIVALSGIISSATISIGFSGYLSGLIDWPQKLTALAIIAFILLVNVAGIRQSSIMNIIFTIIETAGLLFVIWSAAPAVGSISYTEAPEKGWHGLLLGAAVCFFAFTGFEDAVKLGEETKEPEKNIPRGLFIASGIVIVLYVCVALVVVSMIPFQELASSESPLALVVEKRFGHSGALIIAIVALFSTSNSLLSNMLGSSRVLYNFGKENKRLEPLSRVLPGRKTPVVALIISAAIAACFSLIGKVESVALMTNFLMFLTFLAMNVTVIYLRLKQPDLKRSFRIPGSLRGVPVISVLAILMVILLMGYTIYGLSTGVAGGGH